MDCDTGRRAERRHQLVLRARPLAHQSVPLRRRRLPLRARPSEATGGIVGVNASTLCRAWPHLRSNRVGPYVFHATYGHYAGRYNENLVGENSNVVQPGRHVWLLRRPRREGTRLRRRDSIRPTTSRSTARSPPRISSSTRGSRAPITREFTVSGGAQCGRRGHFMARTCGAGRRT